MPMPSRKKKRTSVTVSQFFDSQREALKMKLVAGESGLNRLIREPTINRPGLLLAGFTKYFAHKRIQILGNAETTFLKSLDESKRRERYQRLLSLRIPCVVYSRTLKPEPMLLEMAEQEKVPVFQSPLITMKFINLATLALEMMFAPRGTEMGSMVDILGVGVLVRGESGIGKSECVLALIERGYSLVSDDITHVSLVDNEQVVGTCPEVARNHMEVRGIGIINVAAMFGVKSVRKDKRLDLVVTLRNWDDVDSVDRLGMEEEHTLILGRRIPEITIPVRPGRDLARLIEVAAFQTKLKLTGYNAAKEFNARLITQMSASGAE